MEFKIVYGNHNNNAIHCYDTMCLIKHGLESVGHKADFERLMTPGAINVLIDNFTWDFIDRLREVAQSPGTVFIIVASEFVTGSTFNLFTDETVVTPTASDADHYDNLTVWRKRYRTFSAALEHAHAVWHLVDGQVPLFREHFQFPNTHLMPHAYLPQMERVRQKTTAHKDIDVMFSGTVTAYRAMCLEALRRADLRVASLPISTPEFLREDIVARSRLAIHIRQDPHWEYPSTSRVYFHLMNRSMLVAERCRTMSALTPYTLETPSELLVATCTDLIGRGVYQQEADERHAKFRDEMPMAPLMQELLDATFAR